MCFHPRNYGWPDSTKEIKNNIDNFYRCRSRFYRSFHLIIIRHFFFFFLKAHSRQLGFN